MFFSSHQFDVLDEHSEVSRSCNLMRIGKDSINVDMILIQPWNVVSLSHIVIVDHWQVAKRIKCEVEFAAIVHVGSVGKGGPRLEV